MLDCPNEMVSYTSAALWKGALMASSLRELGAGFCKGNGVLYKSCIGVTLLQLACAHRRTYLARMTVPTADIV